MNRLKRIAAWSLLIVLCFSIFPCKVAYAADQDFTIQDDSGNKYSAVSTDLVSEDFPDAKVYCLWIPDTVTNLIVKTSSYKNASCHCDENKISYVDSNGEMTATVSTAEVHDSWCLEEGLEYIPGAESYIDWNSATSLFTVHLMTGEDLDNPGEQVMIFVQVGGTKLMEDPAPFAITDDSGNKYSAVSTNLVSEDFPDAKVYCLWIPDTVTNLIVKTSSYKNASCHCDENKISYVDSNGEMTATVSTAEVHDSWCLEEGLEYIPGAESYIDWNSATSLFTVHLMTGEDLDNPGEQVMIFVQVGGTKPGSDVTPPELALATDGVERTSDTTATIKFTSNEAGIYYYSLASADVDTSVAGTTMVSGENTLNITGLTAREVTVYIKARDVIGNVMDVALEVAIPTYVPSYEVYLTLFKPAQKGYRYVSTTADGLPLKSDEVPYTTTYKGAQAGQTIKVTLYIPESDKELETVELVTNDSSATPINVTVNGEENSFSFTMPAANVRAKAFTLKDSLAVRYNLKADVSLLYEDIKDSDGNRQGTVTFTDAAGATLVQAKPGQRVTVTAQPRPYTVGDMFRREFVCWKNAEGISIDEENSTKTSFTFTMPASDVYLFAEVKNVGTEITWGTYPSDVADIKIEGLGSKYSPFTFAGDVELNAIPTGEDWWYRYEFTGWTVKRDGTILTDVDTSQLISDDRPEGTFGYATYAKFSVSGEKMTVTANFRERAFAAVTATVNDPTMGSAAVAIGSGEASPSQSAVFEGQTVTLTATPGERYSLTGWEVKDADNNDVTYTVAEDVNVATFIMPDTGKDITAKAIFEVDPDKASNECNVTGVDLYSGSTDGAPINQGFAKEGTKLTITLPANMDTTNLADLLLKFTVSDYATIKQKDAIENWPADGKACGMALDTPVTFTVTAEDGKTTQDYTLTITKAKSSEKEITAVKLLNSDKSVIAEGVQAVSGTTWTITLPSDTDKALIGKIGTSTDVFMQIDYTGASVAQEKGYDDATGTAGKWSSGNVMCGISPNSSKTFTVTAEDGSTKEYTVEIKYTAPDVPTLSDGSATRTSKTGATVKFTSNEAGTYFYKVVEHGAAAPTVDTSKNGTAAVKGENAITLSNLTEDARDIYIVVKNASGGESAALKVEIPAYGSSETPDTGKFTITVNAPTKGGTLTTNRTKADKGDEIIVTVKPDSGYQMVEGSLTYSLAVAGGETVKITGNRFTMPSGNVTITCKWETASVVSSGITGFSINGVAGTVNSTTNTITITMPRGTDVTKLTPAISTSGVKSLTPGSGETVNFTNSVTYTATMDDGSTKTYIVTVYVDKGTLADQFWDRLTDFYQQVPWWKYAEQQQSSSKYPKYW